MSIVHLLSTDNPVFRSYAIYSGVLAAKMLVMSPLTARLRFGKKVFANQEDIMLLDKAAIKFDDPDVERMRRAHLNDLENIPVFFITAFLYTLTDPEPNLAINLFRTYTAARILHTVVYAVCPVRQPARVLAFAVGLSTTAYMVVKVIMYFK